MNSQNYFAVVVLLYYQMSCHYKRLSLEWVRNAITLLLSLFCFVSKKSVYSKNQGNDHITENCGFCTDMCIQIWIANIKKEY